MCICSININVFTCSWNHFWIRDPQVPHTLTCKLSAGGEQPIPLWNEHDTSTDADKPKILLYSLSLMFKVSRTVVIYLEIPWRDHDLVQNQTYQSLRVLWMSSYFTGNPDDSHHPINASCTLWDGPHWAGAVQQDSVQDSAWWQQQLPQALWQMSSGSQPSSRANRQTPGTLFHNKVESIEHLYCFIKKIIGATSVWLQVYEEAGSDFHQVAYFRTRIGLRNALQEEISGSSDKEAVLITLNRPIVFAQPVAFDRG